MERRRICRKIVTALHKCKNGLQGIPAFHGVFTIFFIVMRRIRYATPAFFRFAVSQFLLIFQKKNSARQKPCAIRNVDRQRNAAGPH